MFTFKTIPLLAQAQTTAPYANVSTDTMESYTVTSLLNLLNGGTFWLNAYVSRINSVGIQTFDDMESYDTGSLLNLLNGRAFDWNGVYNSHQNRIGTYDYDTFESYNTGSAVDGLNGGSSGRDGGTPWSFHVYHAS